MYYSIKSNSIQLKVKPQVTDADIYQERDHLDMLEYSCFPSLERNKK